ncbi:hypothetical protein [Fusobacterium sp. FSA-380-WT-2B]|uniref:hypothetical protein n=1 Tax=Fusobacterium sp. FSA-380-WT-2B TaxID=2605786 RepID=UPI0012B29CD2|nr:hypothetical protein [Fusobacterium sp. FSA-380-WT-2B]MSS62123.1 hypothetical protein [Fusobacterium sp. FSA-380-WT-2B]
MTANVSEQLEQIQRFQQQVQQWQQELTNWDTMLAEQVGLGDLQLMEMYNQWNDIYKNATDMYNSLDQMNLQNALDYKKFAQVLLETKSNYEDTNGWEKTEADMINWKKNIDKMSETLAKNKDKFNGQLLAVSSDKVGKKRRDNAISNAKTTTTTTDKQIQQKMLNSLSSIQQLLIEQNEIIASKELVTEQATEVEKQKNEKAKQNKERKFRKAEEEDGKKLKKEGEKIKTSNRKIGYF